jgi:hypothetical protein
MGNPVSNFISFDRSKYPRYKFRKSNTSVFDTKFRRNLNPKSKRGAPPYFRLVNADGEADHVLATDIFDKHVDLMDVESTFDPQDFADRYDFDLSTSPPTVICRGSKGAKAGAPMTLHSPNGWDHWFLRRNDGQRVRVTPAEVVQSFDRKVWEVRPPEGSKVVTPLFANYAFTPDGRVWRTKSDKVLIRPEQVPLAEVPCPGSKHPDYEAVYLLYSEKSGKNYRFSRASIKSVFDSQTK